MEREREEEKREKRKIGRKKGGEKGSSVNMRSSTYSSLRGICGILLSLPLIPSIAISIS